MLINATLLLQHRGMARIKKTRELLTNILYVSSNVFSASSFSKSVLQAHKARGE